jgi:hypothetical protein
MNKRLRKHLGTPIKLTGGNLHEIKDITDSTYFIWDGRPALVKSFAFKIKKDCDCLSGIRSSLSEEGLYGFVYIEYYKNAEPIADQNIYYYTRGLKYWKDKKQERMLDRFLVKNTMILMSLRSCLIVCIYVEEMTARTLNVFHL